MEPARLVTVVGGHSAGPEELGQARDLGRMLAAAGFTVVCGGMGGVMEAACRGAVEGGGLTVGILPVEDPAMANPWVRVALPTGMGSARNRLVALAGAAMVAVGGRYGTLSEIAFALDAGRPVCSMGGWDGVPGVVAVGGPEQAVQFVRESLEG